MDNNDIPLWVYRVVFLPILAVVCWLLYILVLRGHLSWLF